VRSATLAEAAFRDGGDALNIGLAVKLSRGAFLGHITSLAVHRTLRASGAVMFADDSPRIFCQGRDAAQHSAKNQLVRRIQSVPISQASQP